MSLQLIILAMCVLSGLFILDKYSIGEFGFPQPLVSASINGLAVLPLLDFIPFVPLDRLLAVTLNIGLAGGLLSFGIKKRSIPAGVGLSPRWLYGCC